MLKQKTNISLNLCFNIVLLFALPILIHNQASADVTASKNIRDHLQKRINIERVKKKFSCQGELICGVSLIPAFYQQRGFAPAWCSDEGIFPQTESLIAEIRNAHNEGLRPEDFHLASIELLLQSIEKNQILGQTIGPEPWVDIDLLLTDAFMLYSAHLIAGRVNPETIHTDWIVVNLSIDLIDILQSALSANQVGQALRDLRPSHPGYKRLKQFLVHYRKKAKNVDESPLLLETSLRKGDRSVAVRHLHERLTILGDIEPSAIDTIDLFDEVMEEAVQRFQKRHGLKPDGIVGPRTLAMLNIPIQRRIRQIELNMERWRWIPRDPGSRYILVNVADFKLRVVENHQKILEMRVVVGRPFRRTPVFSSKLTYMVINPFWNIPTTIAIKDILPRIRENNNYITQQKIKIFSDWGKDAIELDPDTIDWNQVDPKNFPFKLRQDPGYRNALGRIKFMFPNKFSVYLHDTPKRSLFKETVRDFSSGCIRTEKPIELAAYLLQDSPQWTSKKLLDVIKTGERKTIQTKRPIAVHLQYWTAWVDENNVLHFRDDIYDRDEPLDRALKERLPGA